MRRRLIWTYLTLLTVVLMGLAIPLGLVLASRDSQTMFLDRRSDTAWFASLAEPALRTGRVDALSAAMRRYDELFGVAAVIVSRDNKIMLTSRSGIRIDTGDAQQSIAIALSGQPARFPGARWPWEAAPLVIAEPVGSGGEITGAALTISPAGGLQTATWRSWIVLGSLSLFALLLGVLSTGPIARWTLRPVHDLDEAAHALAAGTFLPQQMSSVGPPELRRLSESFAAMAARVTALLERQRTFASYASHQLRTPLATLRLSVENLAPAVDASGADDYELVAAEIERMAGMCDALLTYALAEVPAGPLTTVNASGVAAGRVAFWAGPASTAGMKITLYASGVVPALAAPNVLDQALDALLSNAIKFAGPGAAVAVRVAMAGDDLVEVHVQDTGPGLSAQELARAAEAFWRRPADQNAEGSGLGITIAQSLIMASGGQLTLHQAVPHGLHAVISLRAVPASIRAGV